MKKIHRSVLRLTILITTAAALCAAGLIAAAASTLSGGINSAPIAENASYKTYRGIAITDQLSAVDKDGDTITFELLTLPRKGALTLDRDGTFVYTPEDGKKGTDHFSYCVRDAAGKLSAAAEVDVQINKLKSDFTYADMENDRAHYAALRLAEAGIYKGEQVAGQHFFNPKEPVTRGEFLAMCLTMCDIEGLSNITRTGFMDDAAMDKWVKPYVSAGLMCGAISGYRDAQGALVFSPDREITMAEAAVIIDNVLNITDVSASTQNDSVPVWAGQAVANTAACSIMPVGADPLTGVTRADAAEMICGALDLLAARK